MKAMNNAISHEKNIFSFKTFSPSYKVAKNPKKHQSSDIKAKSAA